MKLKVILSAILTLAMLLVCLADYNTGWGAAAILFYLVSFYGFLEEVIISKSIKVRVK